MFFDKVNTSAPGGNTYIPLYIRGYNVQHIPWTGLNLKESLLLYVNILSSINQKNVQKVCNNSCLTYKNLKRYIPMYTYNSSDYSWHVYIPKLYPRKINLHWYLHNKNKSEYIPIELLRTDLPTHTETCCILNESAVGSTKPIPCFDFHNSIWFLSRRLSEVACKFNLV